MENKITIIVTLQLQFYNFSFEHDRLKHYPTLNESISYCVSLILRVKYIENALTRSIAVSIRVP